MFGFIWSLSISVRRFLHLYAPTNILLDAIRTRRGLKWGLPAMVLALPYLVGAAVCIAVIEHGGSGLHLLVLLLVWNALKFLAIGPISLLLLIRVRLLEARDPNLDGPGIRTSR